MACFCDVNCSLYRALTPADWRLNQTGAVYFFLVFYDSYFVTPSCCCKNQPKQVQMKTICMRRFYFVTGWRGLCITPITPPFHAERRRRSKPSSLSPSGLVNVTPLACSAAVAGRLILFLAAESHMQYKWDNHAEEIAAPQLKFPPNIVIVVGARKN